MSGWRFAVSTLGAPGVPVRESARVAAEHGCHGLEVRVHPDEEVRVGITAARAARVREEVAAAGVEIACLAGYVRVCAPGGAVVDELWRLVELAGVLGAPAVRVFPGGGDGGVRGDEVAVERIGAVLPELRDAGVRLLVETHDSHATGEAALRLVEPLGEPGVAAVLWDAVHPWRSGESPERTRAVLGEYLGYFQVKDVEAGGPTPVPPGAGVVPLGECGRVLGDWSGWVSLEWERAWYPGIEPLEVPLRAAAEWFEVWRPR
ncbi:sugar phosphate isomerase/epimerase family protein [Actinosynnema mirum]|uniref:Xylose isomerase domain protein TIM barrel n=1 Tax=Actinosynnema mirum (strain ATCC 29888 / DSM 43827 / JCM 3225 / NBRC 14064 / NCIMB 13271 / NRRL B-12336 / IMRU 3971 / 101) TaxID=446462 RepID=C6WPE7_ACTMD|nr:sugar phosphate isomerase/epimerase family protein [Actinosynnema mirum]ACU38649.1 Xylose isomerase domain protein TIM barrel [Actinosynnema mirum DSM 43827]